MIRRADYYDSTNNNTCKSYGTCSGCISDTSLDCFWCASSSTCQDGTLNCSTQFAGTCQTSYYTIIFVCVISSFIFICCGVCYIRRMRRGRGDNSSTGYLLYAILYSFLFSIYNNFVIILFS
jgi:hypothetical protein